MAMIVLESTDDFEISWPTTADAERSWTWSEEHFPRPLVPMAQALISRFADIALQIQIAFANGYAYVYESGAASVPSLSERKESASEIWTKDYEPLVRAACGELQDADYRSKSTAELAKSIDSIFNKAAHGFRNTIIVVRRLFEDRGKLSRFCDRHLGDRGEALSETLLQGYENVSLSSGIALERLAQLAANSPKIAAAIRSSALDDIEHSPKAARFMKDLRSFLEEYGWRAEGWGDLEVPTWAEDPTIPLRFVARYIDHPEHRPSVAHRQAVAKRNQALEAALAQLKTRYLRRRLPFLIDQLSHTVPVRESRARWQLMLGALPRIPLLELGKRFVARGQARAPDDIFYLYPSEAEKLSVDELKSAQALVDKRRADHELWQSLTPPEHIGAEPVDGEREPPPPPLVDDSSILTIHGSAASGGVARGVARVLTSLDQADRIEPGDVLVCRSTAAPWTPLFAIAAALVTDAGGLLSHTAIVAREYGIPAVVGTRTGTTDIPDGATLIVNGDEGTVTVYR